MHVWTPLEPKGGWGKEVRRVKIRSMDVPSKMRAITDYMVLYSANLLKSKITLAEGKQ